MPRAHNSGPIQILPASEGCPGEHCQVYGGFETGRKDTQKAVNKTEGHKTPRGIVFWKDSCTGLLKNSSLIWFIWLTEASQIHLVWLIHHFIKPTVKLQATGWGQTDQHWPQLWPPGSWTQPAEQIPWITRDFYFTNQVAFSLSCSINLSSWPKRLIQVHRMY